jgi:hypothetical protein
VHTDTVSAQLLRLNWLLRASVVEAQLRELKRAVKAGFDPNQPRVPAGNGRPSGQWTRGGGGGGGTQVAQNFPRSGGSRNRGNFEEPTPAQAARLVAAQSHAREVVRRVREIDPAWSPTPSLVDPNSVGGQISAAEADGEQAEAQLLELAQLPPNDLIDAYRRQQGMDLFGEPIWSREQNTLATCRVGDIPLMGMNSGAINIYSAGPRCR